MVERNEDAGTSIVGRVAAAAAVGLALLAAALVILTSGPDYRVRAHFQSASQLVKGNRVQISGRPVGTVEKIELTRDGQAEVTLAIDADAAPLRQGTHATIRIASLSGVANRYVDLDMPPGKPPEIPDGGVIEQRDTTTNVDLDQLFNLFDARARRGLTNVIRGSAAQYAGRGAEANAGWRYLNPSLVGATRLFREINRDTRLFERFIVEQSRLVTDVADRRDDLAGLIDRLATTNMALAREKGALGDAISELPPFMRRANTTFVNLRSTLDDFDPLVRESKPVAPKLRRFLEQLRPFAESATPTFRGLALLARRPGRSNDLLELSRTTLPFRDIAIGPVTVNGKERPGSFATSTRSLRGQTENLAFQRPYAVDFTGWLDDFSHSGVYDANGSATRSALSTNAFAVESGLLVPIPPELRAAAFRQVAALGQNNRCPGSIERNPGDGANPWRPSPDYNCNPAHIPPGS